MSNCFVNVRGGVGNQLFQVAAGYAYAKKYAKKLIINPTRWYAGQGNHPNTYKDTIFKNFEYGAYRTKNVISMHQKRFNYDALPYHRGHVALNGDFQSLKYFEDVADEFISMLVLPEVNVPHIPSISNIAFHIRRGDYLKHPTIHHVCDTKYFDYFFNYFDTSGAVKIFIFTDSPALVLKEFPKQSQYVMGKSGSDLEDLSFISKCDVIVGSNSSFSWWASFIGRKECHFPNKWFADGRGHQDIFREDMTLHTV